MDVHADHTEIRHDPASTAVVPGLVSNEQQQGRLFSDPAPTFADTDKIPVVSPRRPPRPRHGPPRVLRVAVALVALAVVAGGVLLALTKAGVIGGTNGGTDGATSATTTSAAGSAHQTPTPRSRASLIVPTPGTGDPATASYVVAATTYQVTVTTSTGRSWVSITPDGQSPVYSGILDPGTSQKQTVQGASTVQVGAGGTTVTVTSGHRTATLTPPSAPFTYQFATQS